MVNTVTPAFPPHPSEDILSPPQSPVWERNLISSQTVIVHAVWTPRSVLLLTLDPDDRKGHEGTKIYPAVYLPAAVLQSQACIFLSGKRHSDLVISAGHVQFHS